MKYYFTKAVMIVVPLLAFLCTSGCAVYKQLHIESDPTGVRVSRAGAVIGITPFDVTVPAGDILFCSPWHWSFYLDAEFPQPGYPSVKKHIDPCKIPNDSVVHFDLRLQNGPKDKTPAPKIGKKTGTGFVIGSSGLILTAYHVVEGAANIQARLSDGSWVQLVIKSFARANDVAVLDAKRPLSDVLTIAPEDSTTVGADVYTIGFPVVGLLGDEPKYSNGTISSLSGLQGDSTLFQVSVPVQPGNSGGPLCNTKGQVIGIITSSAAVEYFYGKVGALPQNINWAIKIDYALPLLGPTVTRDRSDSIEGKRMESVRRGVCLIVAD
jgi:S1-C subfamily serine protease